MSRGKLKTRLDLATEINAGFANVYLAAAYPGSALYRLALGKGDALPAMWHQYSRHAYETRLRNEHLTAAEILPCRAHAWQAYFSNQGALELLEPAPAVWDSTAACHMVAPLQKS